MTSEPDARVAETHSAWVVMLGDRAYKIKKPVDLGFLDFTDREARRVACEREVALNRRLAPDVYLGVADVVGPNGEPWEHIVVMRRMPDDRRLSTLVERGEALEDEIRAIARVVAAFHAGSATSPEIDAAGSPEVVLRKMTEDLEQMQEFAGTLLDRSVLDDVARDAERYLRGRTRLLEARVANGYIRDGHGDLLADDIFCLPDGPRILDCIDFDDRLRYGDVLGDVAFLAMDLEFRGAAALARELLSAYQEFGAERHPASLVHYYVGSRALIRSKVACVRARQGDAASGASAAALLDLAASHLRRTATRMVIVGGLPGTGKSTLAAGIADRLGYALLRSDEVRKDVAGRSHVPDAAAAYGEGIYAPEATSDTYAALLERARIAIELGEPVVLDASWAHAEWRTRAIECAHETSSDVVELRCETATEVADERMLARRAAGTDVSDANPDVARRMRVDFDAWPTAHTVDTAGTLDESLVSALDAVDADRS